MHILDWLFGIGIPVPEEGIEGAEPGTMLVHGEHGIKTLDYGGEIDEYYHEETAADWLCQREYSLVEIKDMDGRIFRYDYASLQRLGWL